MYVRMNNVRRNDAAYRQRIYMSMRCLCAPLKRRGEGDRERKREKHVNPGTFVTSDTYLAATYEKSQPTFIKISICYEGFSMPVAVYIKIAIGFLREATVERNKKSNA